MRRAFSALAGLLAGTMGLFATSNAQVPERLPPAPPPVLAPHAADTVVLVTLDGVRWQEIFRGVDRGLAAAAHLPAPPIAGSAALLPNVHRLFFEQGTVLGDPSLTGGIAASGPHHVSLPGYAELATGALTSCRSNDCALPPLATIADEVARLEPRPGAVAVFASWERLARAAAGDPSRLLLRAGRDPGDPTPPFPGTGDYRPDHFTAARAAEHLVQGRPRLMWVALGDTDEWAHRGDYRGYLEALRQADAFLGELAAHLDELGAAGARTALLVTADHGRDAGFNDHGGADSAAVWLLARGPSIPRRGAVPTARTRRLRDVAPTIRRLLGLPQRACADCGEPIEELVARPAPGPGAP